MFSLCILFTLSRSVLNVTIALPSFIDDSGIGPVILPAYHPLTTLTCTARSYPDDPGIIIVWAPSEYNYSLSVAKHTGSDGAFYVRSILFARHTGKYHCLLKVTGQTKHFLVKSEESFIEVL